MNGKLLTTLLRRIFVENFYLKFTAAILTLALFIWVSEDRETVIVGYAPVQIVVPDDLVLVSEPVDRVRVTIRGRWSRISRFDISQLEPIRVNLSPSDPDQVVALFADMIRVPPGLRVTHIEPSSLLVETEPESLKTVPVRPRIIGEPAPSYFVEEVSVQPEAITIRGPESLLTEITSIPTATINIDSKNASLRQRVDLRPQEALISLEHDEPVEVLVTIGQEELVQTFYNLPVIAVNTAYDTTISPATTNLSLRGGARAFEELDREALRVEIDLSEEDQRPTGTYSREAEVRNVPRGLTVDRLYPDRFRVTTKEP